MGVHMIDSELFKDHYSTDEMRKIFSDASMLEKWIRIEVALAQAQAELGIIPEEAYEEIRDKGRISNFDMDGIRREMTATAHPLVAFIRQYEKLCENGAGEFVHYGATTQDILDTAVILLLKDGYRVIASQVDQTIEALKVLAQKHKSTPMAGRTHGQHALPITFGFKVAVWLSEMDRNRQRLREIRERVFVGQLGGAVGTLASLEKAGLAVQSRVMEILGLGVPDIPWHTARDNFAELASVYAMIAGTLAKIANEIINLQRTEIAEAEEGFVMGRVGSSTMPHKRNPMICEYVVGLSRLIRGQLSLAFEAMVQEHERDMGLWLTEWEIMQEISILLGSMLDQINQVLANLTVYKRKMRENLDLTGGLILSEKVMFFLSPHIGKQTAHEVVYHACMKAIEKGSSLIEELADNPEVMRHVTRKQLESCLDPENYLGCAREFVDRVLAKV